MKKVVVSGATSLVGVALIEECVKENVQVLALVRKKSQKTYRLPNTEQVQIIECDLEEMKHFKSEGMDYDVFYHIGWSHTDKKGRQNALKQSENIQYSLDAIELAKRLGCKKFVGAGSQAEYGIHSEEKTGPDSNLNPVDAYGICKAAAGKLCSMTAKDIGLEFSWIRIFSLYGKYELPETLIQTTIPKLLNNEDCSFTEAAWRWDYLYSSDAGRAFFLVGEKAVGNNVYCLGSGQAVSLRRYIEKIKEITGSSSKLGFGEIPVTDGRLMGMCADISKLEEDTGWKPKVSFEKGIRREIERIKG